MWKMTWKSKFKDNNAESSSDPVGQMSTHENPPTDPGVVPFRFQLSDFFFSFKKLLLAYI